jgi:hypothetical protein
MLQTTLIFDGQGPMAICHSSEDWLLHHMDLEIDDNSWRFATKQELENAFCLTLKLIV